MLLVRQGLFSTSLLTCETHAVDELSLTIMIQIVFVFRPVCLWISHEVTYCSMIADHSNDFMHIYTVISNDRLTDE